MSAPYTTIPSRALSAKPELLLFDQGLPDRVTMDNHAADVMTDFGRVRAITTGANVQIDTALQKMIHAGVRLLIVTSSDGRVEGIVTARDIMGERPVAVGSEERIPRTAITVAQIMTPFTQVSAIDYRDVMKASVGDIVETLRAAGRQHALVVERDDGHESIRGVFSLTQIGRQLGIEISAEGRVQSFAEIEQALNHP